MYGNIRREARLTVLSEQRGASADFALRQAEQVLGRQPGCDIVIPHPTVSSRHARIFFSDGNFLIEDLGSTNGTAVNQRAISGPVLLRSGDIIQVGEVHLQFTEDLGATLVEPPSASAPPAVESGLTAVDAAPSGWSSRPAFSGEERVSWEQPLPAQPPEPAQRAAPMPESASGEAGAGAAAVPSAAAPAPSELAAADAVAEARTMLTTLAARVADLQRDVTAMNDVAGRLEALLSAAERQRAAARAELERLQRGVEQLADTIASRADALDIEGVLANLDGLTTSPNDLGLLVNVSRDAARYAALVRLVQEASSRLRVLVGEAALDSGDEVGR
ncbi:MAG: FHA domain-containing protein [Chloroflexota bacterium]|nr:FHA domain-containing protein [Dehalococcoidia bacterium]MDW8253003.1 FHA domain-containing protein [Chloroflexota bacterium]